MYKGIKTNQRRTASNVSILANLSFFLFFFFFFFSRYSALSIRSFSIWSFFFRCYISSQTGSILLWLLLLLHIAGNGNVHAKICSSMRSVFAMKSENGRQYQKRMRKWIVMMSNAGMDFIYSFWAVPWGEETKHLHLLLRRQMKDAESFI